MRKRIILWLFLLILTCVSCVPEDTAVEESGYQDVSISIPIEIGGDDYNLEGVLSIPYDNYNGPIVILLQGSGALDMDGTILEGNNKPMKDIAVGLATQNIAVIRFNKRYYQYSYLITDDYTIHDEILFDLDCVLSFIDANFDFSKKILLGHSLGATVAIESAYSHPDVDAVISMAGSPRKLQELLYDQYKFSYYHDETIENDERKAKLKRLRKIVKKINNITDEDDETYLGVAASYWRSLNEINQANHVAKLDIPLLFLQGDKDFQVFMEIDFVEWKTRLGMKDNVDFVVFENLNHYFMPSNDKYDVSEYASDNHVDKRVIEVILKWINKLS